MYFMLACFADIIFADMMFAYISTLRKIQQSKP